MEAALGRECASLTCALNQDALEEVFVHCSPADLLALRATCSAAWRLLDGSEKVWLAKLRESFGLNLKTTAGNPDGLLIRLARRVYEASQGQQLRLQGVFVNGGVDEDAMSAYFAHNMFRADKAPYCSNCSNNADCIALLLDGEVERDAEFARVRRYMILRCRYAAALILNVQMPEHGRDPDAILSILEDWSDIQLEGFFKDLVGALQAEHALGRLLMHDIPQERMAAEEEKIRGVYQWLLERPRAMKAAMKKAADDGNTMLDTSVMPKLTGQGAKRLAGVVHEVALSRVGNLTCPVSAGAVLVGHIDHSKVQGWSAEQVLSLLQSAAADPQCAAFNGLQEAEDVQQAAAQGLLPPIVATDQTLAGIWHEFDTSPEAAARQAAAAAAAGRSSGSGQQGAAAASSSRQQSRQQLGSAAGPSQASHHEPSASASRGQQASHEGIISWRPLLWFRFHTAEEAVAFVRRHRGLIEQHGAQTTLRHHGPAPTRRHHVVAPPGEHLRLFQQPAGVPAPGGQQGAAPAPHAQQAAPAQVLQQQQNGLHPPQPAVAVGVPAFEAEQQLAGAPPQHVAPAPPFVQPPAMPVAGAAPAAAAPAVAVGPQPGMLEDSSTEEDESDDDDEGAQPGMEDDSDSSGSDIDEAAEAQGAWLNNWAQDELGGDLQEQDVVVAGEGLPFDQMDEGSSSSEDDDDDGGMGAEEHFELGPAGAAPAVAGAPALHQQPEVQPSAAETLLRALTRRNTRARNRLRVPLSRPVGTNIVLVKLINQENLMDQFGDPHTWPNIDMAYVLFSGRQVELPQGVVLAP